MSNESYTFSLAQESDDEQLRTLARNISFDGQIQISLHKEPNFFFAERVGTLSLDVLVVRNSNSGKIVGSACRSSRKVFVNGEPREVGYLSGLKGYPEVRGGLLLARGYQEIKTLCRARGTPFCFTTIFSENHYAKSTITSGRAGLPVYKHIGRLKTYVINPDSSKRQRTDTSISVTRGSREILDKIVDFVNTYNQQFQFAPYYSSLELANGSMFPKFEPEHFYVAYAGEEIVGVIGIWDQTTFKQTVVTGYTGTLSHIRQNYNVYSAAAGAPKLPDVNHLVPSFYVSFVAAKQKDPKILDLLLRAVCMDTKDQGRYLFLGLNEQDSLNEALADFPTIVVDSEMYVVYWKDIEEGIPVLEGRMPHFEIATL